MGDIKVRMIIFHYVRQIYDMVESLMEKMIFLFVAALGKHVLCTFDNFLII